MTTSIYAKDLDACRVQLADAQQALAALQQAPVSDVQTAVQTLRATAATQVTTTEGVEWIRWTAQVEAYDAVLALWP